MPCSRTRWVRGGEESIRVPPKTVNFDMALYMAYVELVYRLDAAEHFTARITLLGPTSPGLLEFGIVSLILLSMLLELNKFLHAHYKARLSSYRSP